MNLEPTSLFDIKNEGQYIARMAINEASVANLPGHSGGPYDAYRHLLFSAELTRRLGTSTAAAILEEHEWEGFVKDGQTDRAEMMDRLNNRQGMAIGSHAKSWDDVVQQSKELMKQSITHNGDTTREGAPAFWLEKSQWSNSKNTETFNWPNPTFNSYSQALPKNELGKTSKTNSFGNSFNHYDYNEENNIWTHVEIHSRGKSNTRVTNPDLIHELDKKRMHQSFNEHDKTPTLTADISSHSTKFSNSNNDLLNSIISAHLSGDDKASKQAQVAAFNSDIAQNSFNEIRQQNISTENQITERQRQTEFDNQQIIALANPIQTVRR